MPLAELVPEVESLSRAEKLQLMHILVADLARNEGIELQSDSFPVWTPYGTDEAAEIMMRVLSEHKGTT